MGHLFPHIQQFSFFRDLEWRWRRIICVIEHDQLCSRRTDDRMTGRASGWETNSPFGTMPGLRSSSAIHKLN